MGNENAYNPAAIPFDLTRIFIGVFFVLASLIATPAFAAEYEAAEISRSVETVHLDPGGSVTVMLKFQNAGTVTWTNYGKDFISVYTHGPKYRQSLFRDPSWTGMTQPVRLQESVIGPGNQGTFQFQLTAPRTPGTYDETFWLAAEGMSWIPGGEFTLKIIVVDPPKVIPAPSPAPVPAKPPMPMAVIPKVDTNAPKYQAQLASMSPPRVEVAPGGKASVTLKFRNTGSSTWTMRGSHFISVYTHGPKYRQSAFRDASWYGSTQPAVISEATVEPGGTATVKLLLTAPMKAGDYRETFWLAAENAAWIPGGDFSVPITVRAGDPSVPAAEKPPSQSETIAMPPTGSVSGISSTLAAGYKAIKILTSARDLTLQEGNVTNFRVTFKNTGDRTWTNSGDRQIALAADVGNAYSFRHSSWPGIVLAARLTSDAVQPGQSAFFDVTLAAPVGTGNYVPRFVLTAGGDPVEGGTVDIPVEVTRGTVSPAVGAPAPSGSRGPNIRVGLFDTRSAVTVAATGTYALIEGRDHSEVRKLSGVTSVTFDFSTLLYTVRNGSYSQAFDYHVHLRPDDPTTIFEIQSYSNIPTWDTSINFNKFRGELEIHYVRETGKLWVIEELPLEDYMRGLAETSNGSPMEYQKALVTAARTFAWFVVSIGGKHQQEYHDVNTGAGDQVYKGYVSELVRPNVVRAVEETRGQLVTYGGEVAVTPYFSRSDGRTRSWSEVWRGSRPWLVTKPAPYDAGKQLWGHGVGMSASDALGRAEAGATWQEILKYYYTGITLQQWY